MTKAHQLKVTVLILRHLDVLLHAITTVVHLLKHVDDLFVRASVTRAPKGADTRCNRGEEIRFTTCNHSHSGR